ncbi:putative sulfate exporter family transporter [Aliidiomarina shirensis]|uniref:Putative sulfate exporter family transporter n=1 Tax=Aliidiomarina shirensis TaxID=1048642 RepID=A0A432WQD4_9GAMM|nr:putative sulfate exporter family transporter [Aliidiomarina shirensis]RUO36003.1 putative sulfate exporter family transporter [Aliidiomarina shirensis]
MQVIALKHIMFLFVGLLCLTPFISSSLALVLGLAMALLKWVPPQISPAKLVKKLLAISIVGLGFGVSFAAAKSAALTSLPMIVVFITLTLVLALGFSRLLSMDRKTGTLIGAGTAICGGSAVAAVAPTIQARPDQIAVALGCVFVLNAVGLIIFPMVGHWLAMTPQEFGIWAAVAIHDTSSVVGAAEVYSSDSLEVATSVKLLRALAIAPVAVFSAFVYQRIQQRRALKGSAVSNVEAVSESKPKVQLIPTFIIFYVLAIVIANLLPQGEVIYTELFTWAKRLLVVCLYLVGASMSLSTIRNAGFKPMLLAIVLWLIVSVASLLWITW